MSAYYNEIDPYAAQWLRNLIDADLIAPGNVDTRSIVDVRPDDLRGYTQCHFFAGIGGWSYAARLAGWPDNRPLWTGSCPCQPFSVAGKQEGQADERHLWPVFFALINSRRPDVVMGEQVAAAVGKNWLDGVHSDLEGIGYACGAAVVPASAVDAPHRRDRLWFVADAGSVRSTTRLPGSVARQEGVAGEFDNNRRQSPMADAARLGGGAGFCEGYPIENRHGLTRGGGAAPLADAYQSGEGEGREQRGGQFCGIGSNSRGSAWIGAEWLSGADGKARRFEPGIRLLAHGVPARVGKLRAYGNAIVPQVGAEVIAAFMEVRP